MFSVEHLKETMIYLLRLLIHRAERTDPYPEDRYFIVTFSRRGSDPWGLKDNCAVRRVELDSDWILSH